SIPRSLTITSSGLHWMASLGIGSPGVITASGPAPAQCGERTFSLVRLRAHAAYEDGRAATGEEAYRAYARESGPVLKRVGGRQHWVGLFEGCRRGLEAHPAEPREAGRGVR